MDNTLTVFKHCAFDRNEANDLMNPKTFMFLGNTCLCYSHQYCPVGIHLEIQKIVSCYIIKYPWYILYGIIKFFIIYKLTICKSIVPKTEEETQLIENHRMSEILVVLVHEVQAYVNIIHAYVLCYCRSGLSMLQLAVMPLAPKDVPERRFCAHIHEIGAGKANPPGLSLLPNEESRADIFSCREVVYVVYYFDECFFRFLEHAIRCKFEDESVHRGTFQMAKSLHLLLRNHSWLGLSVAFNLFGGRSVSAFTRSAIYEMREHSSFKYFDYLPQCVLSLGNLVAKITSVLTPPLVLLNTQSLVGQRNKPLVTFRNVKMICLVALGLGKQLARLGVADITKSHYLIGRRVVNLGIFIGHPDSHIKSIRLVITFRNPKVINQVPYHEVICSFTVYHKFLIRLIKGKIKTLTPPQIGIRVFDMMIGFRLHYILSISHLLWMVTLQRYEQIFDLQNNTNYSLTKNYLQT